MAEKNANQNLIMLCEDEGDVTKVKMEHQDTSGQQHVSSSVFLYSNIYKLKSFDQ